MNKDDLKPIEEIMGLSTTKEDPEDVLMFESMKTLLAIGRDEKIEAKERVNALNELQKTYLAKYALSKVSEEHRDIHKTLNKAIDNLKSD